MSGSTPREGTGGDDITLFHDNLKEGTLTIPRCRKCDRQFWYPRSTCPWCGGTDISWSETVTRGRVYSRTVVYRGTPPVGDELPYVMAFVEVANGVRMLSTVVGEGAQEVAAGDEVEVTITPTSSGSIPQWMAVNP